MIHFDWERLYFQIDAGNLGAAIPQAVSRALAEFSQADMSELAQLKPRRNQNTVNLQTSLPLKLKQHAHSTGIVGAASQHPAATAKYGAGEGPH